MYAIPKWITEHLQKLVRVVAALSLILGVIAALSFTVTSPALADTGGYPDAGATTINASQYEWGYPCGNSCVSGWWAYLNGVKYGFLSPRGYAYRNCTDYVAWKLESEGASASQVQGRGNGGQWDQNLPAGDTIDPVPHIGDAAVIHHVYTGDPYGHVAYVENVQVVNGSYQVQVSQYNWDEKGDYSLTGWEAASTYSNFVDFGLSPSGGGSSPPPPPPSGNDLAYQSTSLAGRFASGDTGQDFLYITKNNDGGWTASAWKATAGNASPNKITWAGNYWTQPGSSGVTFANTVFFTGDANGDGLTDLYYASSTNPYQPGFTVGLFINTGNGLKYGNTAWAYTGNALSLANVRFLPGDWTGSGMQGFAYVYPTSDNGFAVGVIGKNSNGFYDAGGDWFTQPGPNVSFYNTQFIPLDANGDGKMDLYYASAQNWSPNGFTVGYLENMSNSTLQWQQSVWTPTNLALNGVKFIPGYWTGGSREGFMYVTQNPDNGFSTAVFTPDANGNLVWDGSNWWIQGGSGGVQFENTQFIPADYDGDGYTDLFYVTSTNWGVAPYSISLWQNTNGHYTGFTPLGNEGNANGVPQEYTVFVPGLTCAP